MRHVLRWLAAGMLGGGVVTLVWMTWVVAEEATAPKPAASESAEKQNIEAAFTMTREAAIWITGPTSFCLTISLD
ncbi:MAG TPA: hypothetical protein VK137_02930 [Planctomycetaceae bacterium]|nr:hypothetical protein [Planctomycetaceae bacterium]